MQSRSNAVSCAMILSAATSLILMVCLLKIDNIVRGTLYNYGLQSSYNWVGPYAILTQLGFVAGWTNIVVAFALQLYNIKLKPTKAEQPASLPQEAQETAKTPEEVAGPQEEAKPTEPSEEAPRTAPEPEAQESKEEKQQPTETPEQKPQLAETDPNEVPVLAGL